MMSHIAAVQASPAAVWQQAMNMAATGDIHAATAHLAGALSMMPEATDTLWYQRMQLALLLLEMRAHQRVAAPEMLLRKPADGWTETQLIRHYLDGHTGPATISPTLPGLLGAIFPGAGHAWLGRWHDAGVCAMLVVPMLLLTVWAARRRMGPVTLFFALITLWLWSGTVFSAVSLAERGTSEAYMLWWQGLWQAAALPGRPW